MENNKEQQPKYPAYALTPRPWSVESHMYHHDGEKTTYLLSKLDFLEACKCVNAMEGIEDPENFVKNARKLIEVTAIEVKRSMLAMKMEIACMKINPDNPMAVAENIQEMFNVLKGVKYNLDNELYFSVEFEKGLNELLTKLQSK